MSTEIISPTNTLMMKINPKYKPVWEKHNENERTSISNYFLPHNSNKPILDPTRPRVLKWYCPFAAQEDFPSGHRYCINVYTGCDHKCVYCYASGYEPTKASSKKNFSRLLSKDFEDLEHFNVPPAPVHLSNSTDPLQSLEAEYSHTKHALEQILVLRHRFTTVTILTKNPMMAVRQGYIELFKKLMCLPTDHPKHKEFIQKRLPGFVIEVSLAFWQESASSSYDPGAPTVKERIEGIKVLQKSGIPLVLHIDPLFPHSPIIQQPIKTMADFGLPEAQTIEDLENLVAFAKEMNVRHVVYSPCKIVQPRGRKLSEMMRKMRAMYEAFAAPEKLVWRGGSWRLPQDIAYSGIVHPFLDICNRHGVKAKYCKTNLIETP